jgi:murein DD-endopeptidase MepM/ murein hydrolase activator NlpD
MQYQYVESYRYWLWLALIQAELWLKQQIYRLELQKHGRFAQSTLVSLILRPFLENERVRALIGAPLVAFMLIGGVTQLPDTQMALDTWTVDQPIQNILPEEQVVSVVTEESGYGMPVATLVGISQRYHGGHPGVDMRAPESSPVLAIENGTVQSVVYSPFGYGTHVEVAHESQVVSMYAHMDSVLVTPSDTVVKGQALGSVGMTGLTTGPHLHFELYQNGIKRNPVPYLQKALETYQQSLAVED